ncbi:uncharacterized protein GLRG_01012 [Colletotrichum graminicola M1.001]|uniref:Uncharacterized protein n=1 Tax=Colletotrichum graminicola (strain M1.001 / M2 / FGSC 10212) TaxID=645133 RepID=E3Q5A1_COLGM|nr:uncharacterized protein GLRG_01012 [Colletotrichum graminicola M1.001]EFQ25868.1 hypothetical protein GLRG_01012 [Colletotrichum graminicola M1.001]
MQPQAEIAGGIESHYDSVVATLRRGSIFGMGFQVLGRDNYKWLDKVAGTGMTDRLASFSQDAWKLWWSDRVFYNLLMDGVDGVGGPAV